MIVLIFRMMSDSTFRLEEPNKTKPPLQVLPVVEGNGEKIRFKDHVIWEYYKIIYSYITSHFSHFLSMAGLESEFRFRLGCLFICSQFTKTLPWRDIFALHDTLANAMKQRFLAMMNHSEPFLFLLILCFTPMYHAFPLSF